MNITNNNTRHPIPIAHGITILDDLDIAVLPYLCCDSSPNYFHYPPHPWLSPASEAGGGGAGGGGTGNGKPAPGAHTGNSKNGRSSRPMVQILSPNFKC